MEIIINLTEDEINAFDDMNVNIEEYLKSIAKSHLTQKIDNQLLEKSLEDKKKLLEVDVINLEKKI